MENQWKSIFVNLRSSRVLFAIFSIIDMVPTVVLLVRKNQLLRSQSEFWIHFHDPRGSNAIKQTEMTFLSVNLKLVIGPKL